MTVIEGAGFIRNINICFDGDTPGGSSTVTKDPAGSGAGRRPGGGRPAWPHRESTESDPGKKDKTTKQTIFVPETLRDKPVKIRKGVDD